MRNATYLAAALALGLLVAACGKSARTDSYSAIVPDAAALTLEAQPGGTGGALTAQAAAVPPPDPLLLTSAVDDLRQVKDRVAELNAGLHKVLDRLEEVMAGGGTELAHGIKVWGPAVRCVEPGPSSSCLAEASLRLVVRLGANDHAGGFVLDARPASSADGGAFRPVVAGWMVRGAVVRRGVGRIWVNLENLKAAAGAWNGTSGFKGEGYLAAGFAAGPFAKSARYRMLNFTRDVTDPAHPPVTVALAGWRSPAGAIRARAIGIGDYDTAGPANELGVWRAVYHPTYGGIAFSAISNYHPISNPLQTIGDVPTVGQIDSYWFGRTCYAAGSTTPEFKEWFFCPIAQGPRACVIAQAGQGTVVAGTGHWSGTSCYSALEPDAVKPPAAAPAGNPLDDSAEDAESDSGLTPQPAPVPDATPETAPPA